MTIEKVKTICTFHKLEFETGDNRFNCWNRVIYIISIGCGSCFQSCIIRGQIFLSLLSPTSTINERRGMHMSW